ncbi:hypothetical protein VFPPC_15942 [Pochonia chlamydosporia 170]|uniref:Uncharacterized protein n=1 Tax=Pochonia chlamydosporia 170 TaxID=1380566 RepID=A0A179FV78_METCM|nr:hypothetical protein VFPPC_15942 [Pochonia chlamydosporia 170]OAQ69277.1 hypothetical protein VFPPC_15942 [Pochonia chlamydosporia 170]
MRFFTLTLIGAVHLAASLATLPTICQSEPPLALTAGGLVSAEIDGAFHGPCQAVLQFDNTEFLPLTVEFGQIACSGRQIAEFSLPSEAPAGAASIHWLCVGQPSPMCSSAVIANMRNNGNARAIPRSLKGRLGCIEPVAAVLITTLTTTLGTKAVATTITTAVASFVTGFAPGPVAGTWLDGASTTNTWLHSNDDRTGRPRPTDDAPNRRTSGSNGNPPTSGTCDPASCLALVPQPDTTTNPTTTIAGAARITTTTTDAMTTGVPTTHTATSNTSPVPATQTFSSTAARTQPLLGPTLAATTVTVIQTITLACGTSKTEVVSAA